MKANTTVMNKPSSFPRKMPELERNQIIERCQTGKAIARQNPDFTEGRPKKYSRQQVQHALDLLESHSYKQVEQMTGISKSTLIRAKKALK